MKKIKISKKTFNTMLDSHKEWEELNDQLNELDIPVKFKYHNNTKTLTLKERVVYMVNNTFNDSIWEKV